MIRRDFICYFILSYIYILSRNKLFYFASNNYIYIAINK